MTQPAVGYMTQKMYDAIKQWHTDDAENGWAGLRFCQAVCEAGLEIVATLSRDTTNGPGWSALLDLNRCPIEDLPYLAQFRGVQIPGGLSPEAQRAVILSQPSAARGRPATIIAAVKQTLSGSQHIALVERDTSPYHATIQVYQVQVVDEALTLAAIAANKPAGLIIDLEIIQGPTYGETKQPLPADPNYGDREGYFPTYGDIQEFVPS